MGSARSQRRDPELEVAASSLGCRCPKGRTIEGRERTKEGIIWPLNEVCEAQMVRNALCLCRPQR